MKKRSFLTIAAALAVVVFVSPAFMLADVTPFSAKTDAMVKEWERAKAYTKEYLDATTDDAMTEKPTPEMRSLGEQFLHLSEANYVMASTASGVPTTVKFGAMEKGPLKTKAEISKATLDSYDFVIAALKGMTDEKLASHVSLFNMDLTAETVFAKVFEHQTHHRGQTTVYLRLKGIKPPQEKLF